MIGLEYIILESKMSQSELADNLGIKKQNITLWLKQKQDISKKHIPKLVEILGVDEVWFKKELNEIDKIEIKQILLNNQIKNEEFEYDDEFFDSDTNEWVSVKRKYLDMGAVEHLDSLEVDKKEQLLLNKIKNTIHNMTRFGFGMDDGEFKSLHEYDSNREQNIKLFERFIDIINCKNVTINSLHETMRAMELTDSELSKKYQIWGKGRINTDLVEDERPMTQEILNILNKYNEFEREKLEKRIQEGKELAKLLEEIDEDLT